MVEFYSVVVTCVTVAYHISQYYTRLKALCQGLPTRQYQKGKTSLHLLEQEMTSAGTYANLHLTPETDKHHSTPPLKFLQVRCPSCCRTNSIKALISYCNYRTVHVSREGKANNYVHRLSICFHSVYVLLLRHQLCAS